MLEDMHVHPQDQHLPIEDITSPLLEFCESELFPDQNSEVASTSNCCFEDHSSYQTHLPNMNTFTTPNIEDEMTAPPPAGESNLSDIFFDEDENDISASIDFTTSPSLSTPNHHHHHHQYFNNNNDNNSPEAFNMSSLTGDMLSTTAAHQYGDPERWATAPPVVPLPLSTSNYDEECLPPYIRVGSSQPGIHDSMIAPYLPPGIFMGSGLMHQQLDYQGDNAAIFLPDTIVPRVFNCSTQLQGMSESQHVVHGGASTMTTSSVNPSLASEISSLEDATFKVGKISVEERKKKIHRYMKKRNERNFSKKIKYACRKTLADSRPRVRGRFAKNDELMMDNNHEDENDHQDITLYSNSMPHPPRKVVLKEEEDHDPSEIYAHISGVNSFKYTYIESWM